MENVFVTCFFDIGRGTSKKYSLPRSTETYFKNFEYWAPVKNMLVAFCAPEHKALIEKIRRKYGLADKTVIIAVENPMQKLLTFSGQSLIEQLKKRQENSNYRNIHFLDNAMSLNVAYDYVMYLKYYCLREAKALLGNDYMYVWFDFGFDKQGMRYEPSAFQKEFILKKEISQEQVTFFAMNDPEKTNILELLVMQADCMIGSAFLVPGVLVDDFVQWAMEAIETLLNIDAYDDDQMIMLMIYKKHKSQIDCYKASWTTLYAQAGVGIAMKPHYPISRWNQFLNFLRAIKHNRPSAAKRLRKMHKRVEAAHSRLAHLANEYEVSSYGKSELILERWE